MANLARLPWELKSAIDTSKPQDDFNKDLPIRRLLHFIRQESFGFEDVMGTLYIGLDVHKATIAVSLAEEGRDGAVRNSENVDPGEQMRRLLSLRRP